LLEAAIEIEPMDKDLAVTFIPLKVDAFHALVLLIDV